MCTRRLEIFVLESRYALKCLAQLDNAHAPRGPQLMAEAGDQLRAALSLPDGAVVANPFDHTAELVTPLRARATQLSGRHAELRTPIFPAPACRRAPARRLAAS